MCWKNQKDRSLDDVVTGKVANICSSVEIRGNVLCIDNWQWTVGRSSGWNRLLLSSPILHLHFRPAVFSMVFRALIVLFSYGYKIEICKIVEATFLTLYFCPMRDFLQVTGRHGPSGPMVDTLVCRLCLRLQKYFTLARFGLRVRASMHCRILGLYNKYSSATVVCCVT